MPKKYAKFLELINEQLFYIKDNIVVFYFPVLKRAGFTGDDLKLILENLQARKIIIRYNIRYALNILPIPTSHQKKVRLLKGMGWTISDSATSLQYVIETFSRESFFEFYESVIKNKVVVNPTSVSCPNKTIDTLRENRELDTLHPKILEKCSSLYLKDEYPEAAEKGFKVVRDRLRELTGHERGSDAFGKAKLYIKGAAAKNVEADFNEGVKFLTMAIDMFRNEKSHTANAKIDDSVRAYEYLRLSSLAMNLLDQAIVMEKKENRDESVISSNSVVE